MSMKIYNIRSIEYNSDKRSYLWIGLCRGFPKRSSPNGLLHLAVCRKIGLQWLETSPIKWQWIHIQWQWFIFDQIQFRYAAMPLYWSLLLFPQIDCPKWLPHLADSRRSEPQLSVTPLWCDHGYNGNANLWAPNATHSVLNDAIIWQKTLELIEIKLQ